MNILAIDTAGRSAAVAVLQGDALLYESFCNTGFTHSETLLPMVDAALAACGLKIADIGLFGVTAGPGSFTGLRIGLAAVKGLAFAGNTPCAGVSTLAALAYGHTGQGTVVAALDARRGQVYWAGFELATHARLTPDAAEPVEALADFITNCKKPLFFVGDGAALCYNTFMLADGLLPCPPALRGGRGAGVGLAALACYQAGLATPPAALLPSYHRLSQAERERAEREAAPAAAATPPKTVLKERIV
ncbi:MAG: tRNA (adenosine(37)-N6)-threonylcarbamoyltransferase complex dimerization subunit type 1 TsaB [Gemmiger sp.]|nr:tRNA (adenosine(37)-N6)-threonylcarbamoyltransferase complex dimerization subunit type 1 TsaB [Gemmiger sp.]